MAGGRLWIAAGGGQRAADWRGADGARNRLDTSHGIGFGLDLDCTRIGPGLYADCTPTVPRLDLECEQIEPGLYPGWTWIEPGLEPGCTRWSRLHADWFQIGTYWARFNPDRTQIGPRMIWIGFKWTRNVLDWTWIVRGLDPDCTHIAP